MLELHDLDIHAKPIFDKHFAVGQHEISDLNFTNLYMWRKPYHIKYCVADNFLCIFAQYGSNPPFALFPISDTATADISPIIMKLKHHFDKIGHPLVIRSLTPQMKYQLERCMPGMFGYTPVTTSFDYIYNAADLISLQGKKYHAKRNHINKFIASNNHSYHPLTSELAMQCIEIAKAWYENHDGEQNSSLSEELNAIIDTLSHFDILGYKGGVLKVDGNIVAFTYGEKLTDNMAVIHVEKADAEIHGSYAMINQQFCEHEWQSVAFINREEDMGLEGLRKAKLSYYPAHMSEKHTATMITD